MKKLYLPPFMRVTTIEMRTMLQDISSVAVVPEEEGDQETAEAPLRNDLEVLGIAW